MVMLVLFGVRVFARPMRYWSSSDTLSFVVDNDVTIRSSMVYSGLQKCSATPDLSTLLLIKCVFQSSACLSDVLAVLVSFS